MRARAPLPCTSMATSEEELAEQFEDLQINLQLVGTKLFRGDQCLGTGVLKVDEIEVSWTGDNGDKVCLSYPEICLHAVSRDVSTFPHACLFMLTCSEQDSDTEDTGSETVEMRLVLEDEDHLDSLFDAISEGQSLNPDPNLSTNSEEEEGDNPLVMEDVQVLDEGAGFFRTPEDLQYLSPEGQRTLEHLERLLATSEGGQEQPSVENGSGEPNDQFEDAD